MRYYVHLGIPLQNVALGLPGVGEYDAELKKDEVFKLNVTLHI